MPFIRVVDRGSTAVHRAFLTVSEWPYEFIVWCTCKPVEIARMPMETDLKRAELKGAELSDELMRLWRTGVHNLSNGDLVLEPSGHQWVWANQA